MVDLNFSYYDYTPTERDNILDRAQNGELTPEQAEMLARDRGLVPFAVRPEEKAFDPLTEVWWTLPMAAAWVVSRDLKMVRFAMPEYAAGCWEWVHKSLSLPGANSPRNGWRLEQREELSLADIWDLADVEQAICFNGSDARMEMLRALQSGRVQASGLPGGGMARTAIDATEWIDLTLNSQDSWPSDSIGMPTDRDARYSSVRVRAEEVRNIWPANANSDIIAGPIVKTGCAGRPPKSADLIESYIRQEYSRFKDLGPTDIARDVLVWLSTHHKAAEKPKENTLKNTVRRIKREIDDEKQQHKIISTP